jgi:hypothetical protein
MRRIGKQRERKRGGFDGRNRGVITSPGMAAADGSLTNRYSPLSPL